MPDETTNTPVDLIDLPDNCPFCDEPLWTLSENADCPRCGATRKERRLARRHDCSDIETIRNWATGKERPPAEDD